MNNYFKWLAKALLGAARLILGFLAGALRLLASGNDKAQDNNELGNAVRGGDLNFRTGKFDEGTDPAGWYDRD